ncbi:MAG: DUF4424 family protein [Methylocystaceae bacterium]|nr:DUF4424 family protein [Methylocystaceae bacterium]
MTYSNNPLLLAIAYVLGAVSSVASANDSSAALTAGGLVLTQNDDIAMEREALDISYNRVSVFYQFRNMSDVDKTVRIAFPLPDIRLEDVINGHPSFPVKAPNNFVAFKTVVDGAPVDMNISQRMWVGDKDVTDEYISYDFPPSLADERVFKTATTEYNYALLTRIGAFGDPGMVQKTAYHWSQTFPADTPVQIKHEYKPVPGIFPVWREESVELANGPWRTNYCLSDEAISKITQDFQTTDQDDALTSTLRIPYVLKTGANWKGGIGSFQLQVVANDPYRYAALCAPDRSGGLFGSVITVNYDNFQPTHDLDILFFGAFH